jgi:hypothetical protein
MPTFTVDKSKLEGIQPVPAGWYEIRFEGFKPAKAKDKNGVPNPSINFNPQLKIINYTSPDGKDHKLMESMNSQAEWIIQDMVHAFGFEMEQIPGTEQFKIPGDFAGDDAKPETWVYTGPLQGAVAKVEVVVTSYQGKPQNKIKQWACAVQDCKTKNPKINHSTNLIK